MNHQLEDLHMLQCSLLPGELLTFLDDTEIWSNLLEAYSTTTDPPNISEARFQIKLDNAEVWFEVHLYPGAVPVVSVKGDMIAKDKHERWQTVVKQKLQELEDSEHPIYELFSVYLLPLLHAEVDSVASSSTNVGLSPSQSSSSSPAHYHALLTSHHLVSPQKRRSFQRWSSDLSISGFAKVGYPGVIYAEGVQGNVEEFVANVKAMQWLALRVRFIEPVEKASGRREPEGGWAEFQKVGEVVEEMKRIGREEFILKMGIGSVGSR